MTLGLLHSGGYTQRIREAVVDQRSGQATFNIIGVLLTMNQVLRFEDFEDNGFVLTVQSAKRSSTA